MSHLTSVKTQIKDLQALSMALVEMGFALGTKGVVSDGRQSVDVEATLSLPGGRSLGFVRGADGTFDIVGDWYYTRQAIGQQHEFVGRLSQLYGVHKATLEATLEGYLVERQTDENGIIRLTLTRP